jgi:hypothetical protein
MNVNESTGKQGKKEAEVPCQGIYPLRALRQSQSRLSQVQDMPDLFQNLGERGQNTGSEKSQLVSDRDRFFQDGAWNTDVR